MKRHASFTFPTDPDRDDGRKGRRAGRGAGAPRSVAGALGPLGSGRWARTARAVGLAPDAPVLVALSGGADSVYLLHLVAAAKPRPPLVAVHVDHGLRGEESRADAEFCARLAASLGVPFVRRILESLDVEAEAGSLEARARSARYRVLCEEAVRAGVASILTGHHADDALETLLQRWMRGTDVKGLPGLRRKLSLRGEGGKTASASAPRSSRGANERLNETGTEIQVVRPLLAMRREEVRRILSDAGIAWREDSSNQSSRFTRNRVRNELLPAIEATCGPDAVENLRAFGAAVEALEERCAALTAQLSWSAPLFAEARRGPSDLGLGGTLERSALLSIPSPLRRRALWRLLAEGAGRAPAERVLGRVLDDLAAGRTTRHSLPGGWGLHLRSDLLHLEPPAVPQPRPQPRPQLGSGSRAVRDAIAPPRVDGPDPQLLLPFAAREMLLPTPKAAAARLEIPGLVTLPDQRQITAEIVYLPPGTDVLRSSSTVEIDARDFVAEPPWSVPPLHVRFLQPGDRFHALGAPGSKALARFLADCGVPREARGRVPLVFADDELVWVAGIRPCEARRVRPDTEARLRLALHVAAAVPPRAVRPAQPAAR